jgi:hypothetical protein
MPGWQIVMAIWLVVVVVGCFGLPDNQFNAFSAQSDFLCVAVLQDLDPYGHAALA